MHPDRVAESTSQANLGFFHQAAPLFPIPERIEVHPPEGNPFSGKRAKVCYVLWRTAKEQLVWPVGQGKGSPGAVPKWALAEPWCGGSEGARRMRELRDFGLTVGFEEFADAAASTLYRLRDTYATAENVRDAGGAFVKLTFGSQHAASAAGGNRCPSPASAAAVPALDLYAPVELHVGKMWSLELQPPLLMADESSYPAFLRRRLPKLLSVEKLALEVPSSPAWALEQVQGACEAAGRRVVVLKGALCAAAT